MKRTVWCVAAALLVLAPTAHGQGVGWTISSSSQDPFVNSGPPGAPGTLTTLYLWYACNENPLGITAMEADLSVVPLAPLSTMNGFLNAGESNEHLLLVRSGCHPALPVAAGSLLFLEAGAGLDVCLVPSAANGFNLTVDCGANDWDNDYVGYSSTGSPPCATPCLCTCPLSVESRSWSATKALYR